MMTARRTGRIEIRRILALLAVFALTVACVVAVDASPAKAATWSVGTEAELKDALVTLSSDSSGPHLVTLTADIVLAGSHAVYSGTRDLTIEGNGHFVSGNNNSRVFYFPISGGVTVTLQNLIIENGRSSGEGGYGGGIAVNAFEGPRPGGDLVVINSVVRNNTAVSNDGGGISVPYGGDLTLIDSMVLDNQAQDAGGVIATHVEVIGSTVANNHAGPSEDGGGIFGETVTLINSTVSGNTGGAGSGIYSRGPLMMVYSTVADNGNGIQIKTFTESAGDADLTAFGSLVANPSSSNCAIAGATTSTYSYDDGATCGFTDTTDQSNGSDPLLGALTDNGQPTLTRLPGAPLVDQIPTAACDATVTTDQRGVTRPQGPGCDIGAVEIVENQPVDVVSVPDWDGVGADEVGVLLVDAASGVSSVVLRDEVSGSFTDELVIAATSEAIDVEVTPAGDVAVLLRRLSDGQPRVRVFPSGGGMVSDFLLSGTDDLTDLEVLSNGDLAVLSRRTFDDMVLVRVIDPTSPGTATPFLFGPAFSAEALHETPTGMAVLGTRGLDSQVRVRELNTTTSAVRVLLFGKVFSGDDLAVSTGGDLGVVGTRSSDDLVRVRSIDLSGLRTNYYYGTGFTGIDVEFTSGVDPAVLGNRASDQQTRFQARDAITRTPTAPNYLLDKNEVEIDAEETLTGNYAVLGQNPTTGAIRVNINDTYNIEY